jgi:RHS repeat-associated protein
LDEETGLYYYGARYLDQKLSIWLSVDPLAEMFPGFSPYAYALLNPVKLIDPTGMAPQGVDPNTGKTPEGGDPTPGKETELPEIVITGKRNYNKVGIRHSYWNGYTAAQGAASSRLQQAIKANPATRDIDRTINEAVSWIPGAEGAELGNAIDSYEEGEYWDAGFSLFASIPLLGKIAKLGKIGKVVGKGSANLAKTPVGRSGNILKVITKNSPTTINGTKFTGHALDQMQARGILSPSAVLDVIKNPARMFLGNTPGTSVFIRDNLKVITNKAGDIITVIPQ